MAYATDADLLGRIPSAATVPTGLTSDQWIAARGFALADAMVMIDDERFDQTTTYAHVMYAAHLLACRFPLSALGGEAGPVTSMSAGEISASYAIAAPSEDKLSTTRYGREYDRVAAAITAFPTCVG